MLNNSMAKSEVYDIILATTDMNEDVYAYLCGRTHVCNSTVSLSVEKPARPLPSGITGSMLISLSLSAWMKTVRNLGLYMDLLWVRCTSLML